MLAAVLVVVAVPLVLVGKWYAKKREERLSKEQTAAANRAAVLQIVDGLSRGKLITLDKDKATFKIGAATGPGDTEKNDLILSDSATLVSRYHCSLIRRAGDYFFVDSSLTALRSTAICSSEGSTIPSRMATRLRWRTCPGSSFSTPDGGSPGLSAGPPTVVRRRTH